MAKLSELGGVAEQAGKAAAETRAWAGPGRMAATAIPNDDGGIGSIWLITTGLQPKDLGVAAASTMKDELVLVHGPPWVADCAAGTRTNCPPDFEDKYVVKRTWAEASDGPGLPSDWKALTGSDGTLGLYVFPGNNGKEFNPAFIANTKPGSLPHLYVVARHDPLSPNDRGKVLGTIALRFPFGGTGMPISWLQQKLLSDVLGVSNKWRDQFGRIGVDSTSTSPAYCIEGVPKDLFVPLENELTSDSDQYENSWKHYLTLAKQAAQKADDLGQSLIELGLQQDLRREAAGESLANICGDFSALDEIKIENGVPTAPPDDENLKSCLEEEKFDLVLLTNDPMAGQDDSVRTAWVQKEILRCGSSKAGLCGKAVVDYAGLGLATYVEPFVPSATECDAGTGLMTSLASSFKGALGSSLTTAEWATSVKLRFLAKRLSFHVADDMSSWQVLRSGLPVMSSSSNQGLWPGCRRAGGKCDATSNAVAYDKLFRRSPPGSTLGAAPDDQSTDPASFEANLLLWRVQGALWMLGAMGGTIPESLFDVVIPAANFNGVGWNGQTPTAPVYTVFATGRFDPLTKMLEAPPAVAEPDRTAIGKGTAIANEFWWPSAAEGLPTWLSTILVSPHDRYLGVRTANPEIEGFGAKDVGKWLTDQLARFDGMKCSKAGFPSFADEPQGPAAKKHQDGAKAVSAMRAGENWGRICSTKTGLASHEMFVENGQPTSVFRDRVATTPGSGLPLFWAIPFYPLPGVDELLGFGQQAQFPAPIDAPEGTGLPPACEHARPQGVHTVHAGCAKSDQVLAKWSEGSSVAYSLRYTNRMLVPRACSAGARAQLFVNSYPAPGPCGAAAQVAQALGLACQLGAGGFVGSTVGNPPTIKKLEDLDGFVDWIGALEREAREQVGRLYVEKVPKKVVGDYLGKKVGTGVNKGEHGSQLLELRKSLETLAGSWNRVAGNVGQLRNAVDGARIGVLGAKIDNEMASAQLAIQRMQIHANMLSSMSGLVGPDSASVISGSINAAAQIAMGAAMLDQTQVIEKLSKEKQANQVQATLNQLQLTSNPLYTDLQNAIGDIRSSTATALSISNSVQQSESQAKYEAAKGSGADFVMIDNKPVKFPVNTVQNRLYDITRLRYLGALDQAKYLAYVARLAIEQRIGQRLNTIATPVGPIEAPKEWADDVCSLTGINYQKLRDFDTDAGAGSDGGVLEQHQKDLIAEFADQYIGDYVDKLGNFVEYYNIAYPSHDGDDTAVLSLKDDLLGPIAGCVKEAPNLLFYSSALESFDVLTEGGQTVTRGWELNPCDASDSKCLRVSTGATMKEPASALPVVAPVGGVTWLHDEANPLAGAPVPDGGAPLPVPTLPTRTVSQGVSLTAGSTYVLSWWDQARTADGSLPPTGSTGVKYRVAVLAPDGSQVEGLSFAPHLPSTSEPWSGRRSLDFKASQTGTYRVLFGASFEGAEHGSVALANAQLEQGAPGSLPSAYVNTGASRLYLAPECTGKTAEDVQKAFRHVCDATKQCYYELVAPIVVDTNGLDSGKSRLNGKLAAGNFNFRHITLAVNLVGTGVYDCTANPSQSCFGSAFIEYTIDHDAFQAGVIDWKGDVQTFNFGSAGINHGKALAAEKYITLPIGSGDQNLLAQPGIEKPEYRGRPLDGSYRLRIWDSPYLMWNRLVDIQLVLTYRYWSRIQPQPAP
ncbi:MAG: hypothetical protein IT377_28825 [Polyangiaceae bacterium]|nr:hypothetical protein [Polyangiaceae bacterium]